MNNNIDLEKLDILKEKKPIISEEDFELIIELIIIFIPIFVWAFWALKLCLQ